MARRSFARMDAPRGTGFGRGKTDIGTLGLIGVICAVAGFFVIGIVLGPVAMVCGWLGMGRSWRGSRPLMAVIALVLGAIDLLVALLFMAQ